MKIQENCLHQEYSSEIEGAEEKRTIAYGRAGKVEELSGQRAMIEQIAKIVNYGIDSDHIYFDFGSANAASRPAFEAASKMIKEGKVNCLIVTHLDRITRRFLDFLLFMELLKKSQVELVVLDKPGIKNNEFKKDSGLWPGIK